MSRSATLVIAYLIRKNEWSLKKAFDYVKLKRPIIGPNEGFMNQLKNFEKMMKLEIAYNRQADNKTTLNKSSICDKKE